MGAYENIDIDFAKRTLRILEQYDQTKQPGLENFEVTLLVNCLIGLLVLPQQRRNDRIPDIPVDELADWGIEPGFIASWGKSVNTFGKKQTLRRLVYHLRNGVCHFRIEAEGTKKDIERLTFSDQNGFRATIPVDNLKTFAKKFASTLSSLAE
jgi:hypothetical protein